MRRRQFLAAASTTVATAFAGCVTSTVDSEVDATAAVVDTEYHDESVTATIEVESKSVESGTVGLHIHYFSGGCSDSSYHTHLSTVHVPAGDTVVIRDSSEYHDGDIGCVSAHVKQ